jgi:hypothetical protein
MLVEDEYLPLWKTQLFIEELSHLLKYLGLETPTSGGKGGAILAG